MFVRHGSGRGPKIRMKRFRPAYFQPFIEEIRRSSPNLFARFVFWETGQHVPDLSDIDCVVFWLQDPLRERFPACFDDAFALEEEAKRRAIKMFNPPSSLSHSIKSVQAKMWLDAGLLTPPVTRIESYEKLMDLAQTFSYPLILRADQLHAQKAMKWVDQEKDLKGLNPVDLVFPIAASPFMDTRMGYETPPYSTHYHKKRALVMADQVRNNHVFFALDPIVGSKNSTFGHGRSFNPVRRMMGNRGIEAFLKADFAFFEAWTSHREVLLRASEALQQNLVSIDYSTRADGQVVLWEANPHFALHMWPLNLLAAKRQIGKRTQSLHQTIRDGLIHVSPS